MNNALVKWTLPTVRQGGGTLRPSDIDKTEVSISGDAGGNFALFANVSPAGPQQAIISDLDPGDYIFRIVVVDVTGQKGTATDLSGTVADDSAPGAVTDASVTFS